tara:strand:- start:287 stop:814 length:528 start_codon:yes stop_codon:yes gene_type:complete
MLNTFPLFSVNAYRVNIKDWSKKHRDRILDLVPDVQKQTNIGSRIHYTDYHNSTLPPYHSELMKVLTPYLEDFLKENGINHIATLWCQKYKSGDYHPPHDHGSVGFSAVLYAKLDSDVHPSTQFFPPFPSENGTKVSKSFQVEEGDLIIFPAHVLHMAPPHYDDKMRVIFSFNLI